MGKVLKILRFCSNGHIGGLTVQTGFKMANTRQAYMLIVCVCVRKSARESTAKALPLAHHECMLNAWKNGKVERFRYVKITSISPKLSILMYRVVVLHILCNSHLFGMFDNCFFLNIFGRNKTIGFWHYLTHPVCFPFSFYVQSLKCSFPFFHAFTVHSQCANSNAFAVRSLALFALLHSRPLFILRLHCVHISFTVASLFTCVCTLFALCVCSSFSVHKRSPNSI